MPDGLEQVAIVGGKLTIPLGVAFALVWKLLEKWMGDRMRLKKIEAELLEKARENEELKAKAAHDLLAELRATIKDFGTQLRHHDGSIANLTAQMAELRSMMTRLSGVLERVLTIRSEKVSVGKDATLVRTKKTGEGGGT